MRFLTSVPVALLLSGTLLMAGASAALAVDTPPGDTGTAMSGSESDGTSASSPARSALTAATAVNPTASTISLTQGLKGFDNIGVDSPAQLSCLSAAGYTFDVIDALGSGWDTEYRSAAAIGMSAVLFQGFYQPFWSDPAQGTARGQLMVTNAQSVGYPQGAQVYLNLENNLSDGTNPVSRATIVAWVKNWVAVVTAAGYQAGVYVGVPQVLTSADLDSLGNVVFWRSASSSAPQVSRGYVMRQPSISVQACSTTIDADTSGSDNSGASLVGAGFPRPVTVPTVPGALGPLTPARILDTRNGGTMSPSSTTTVQITGQGGVPSTGASAVVINLTAVAPTAAGDLVAWPAGTTRPLASNLNFTAGEVVPNLVVVPLGAGGEIQIFNHSGGNTDIIIDVTGYYLAGTPTAAGTLAALSPARILDSRDGGTMSPSSTTTVQITGQGGVPSTGVSAVVINLTAVTPTAAGDLVAWPAGTTRPLASNLNFTAGEVVPNLVVVPLGAGGQIQIFNHSGGNTDIIIDVAGYFLAGTPTAPGALSALTPARILDTRNGGTLPPSSASAVQITGQGGVPGNGVSAVVINLTAVTPTAPGDLVAWPAGKTRPLASNLNFIAGEVVPNLVVVPVGPDGKIQIYNHANGNTDIIVDVVGYVVG